MNKLIAYLVQESWSQQWRHRQDHYSDSVRETGVLPWVNFILETTRLCALQ